jgi:hypothetical protein
MISQSNKATSFYFLLAIMFFFSPSTHAYVLQGPHLLDLMIEKLGAAESLYVSQALVIYRVGSPAAKEQPSMSEYSGSSVDTGEGSRRDVASVSTESVGAPEILELDESLRYVFSHAFRSEARSLDSERIYVFANGKTLTIIDGNIVDSAENRLDLYKDLLLFRSRWALVERLPEQGVDISISSLGRFEGQRAYVVGAEYPDESVSQIWIDQETFLPIRWIIKGLNGQPEEDTLEVRYLDWWKVGKTRYPSRIEFIQQGKLVRVSQVKNVELNPNFPEELFNVEYLKAKYPQVSLTPSIPGESEEPSEVQKTIEEFRRIFD